jgi:hypothetical protein
MSDADHDPVLQRAIDELRQLPPLDRQAVGRVVSAAAAARLSPADEPVFVERAARGRSIRVWSAIGMAAAAAVVGFVARGQWRTSDARNPVAASRPLFHRTDCDAPNGGVRCGVDRSFSSSSSTMRGRNACRSSGISYLESDHRGDDAVVQRGLWSVIIPFPGRQYLRIHGRRPVFTLDPRAPKVRDADLGTEGSVVIVGGHDASRAGSDC